MKKFIKIISYFYIILLTILLLIPLDLFFATQIIKEESQPSNSTSYIIHIMLFFILYLLLDLAFQNKIKILLFCFVYSILLEVLQLFTSRGFQSVDILFNFVGIIIAFLFIFIFRNSIRIKS